MAIVFRSGCSARTSDPFGDDTGVNADGKRSVKLLNHAADNQRFFLTAKRRRCHWAALIWDECAVFYNERSGQRRRVRQWVSKRSGQVALRSSLLMWLASNIQGALIPRGSFPKSERNTEPISWTERRNWPGTLSVQRGTIGHTLTFGYYIYCVFCKFVLDFHFGFFFSTLFW